ncbi:EamA family transporter [Caldalkalibacillus salinus]|uniref:EamA family transporter n=1 Tax=Caldalkalibacillus salinus TaxID=2803787 RepID=UPI0019217B96
MKHYLSVLLVLFAAMLWGTTGTAQTFVPEAHPVAVGAMRLAVGGLVLLVLVYIQGHLNLKGWPLSATGIAAISMAAYQPFFFSAVAVTGVAIGTVVGIGSAPILAGVLEWLFKGRVPDKKWWLATVLAIIGCLLLFTTEQDVSVSPLGVLLALGAGLSFAVYTFMNKQLIEHHPPEAAVAVVFTLSAIILSPLLFLFDLSWVLQGQGIAVALHLGVFATAVAYLLFSKGLLGVPASTAVTLALAEPLTAAMLGVFIVGEVLTLLAWGGIFLLFLGLGLLSFERTPKTGTNTNKADSRADTHAKSDCEA